MKKEIDPKDLVSFYWLAEEKRAECPEITLIEIATEFHKNLPKSLNPVEPEPFTGIKQDESNTKYCNNCKVINKDFAYTIECKGYCGRFGIT